MVRTTDSPISRGGRAQAARDQSPGEEQPEAAVPEEVKGLLDEFAELCAEPTE